MIALEEPLAHRQRRFILGQRLRRSAQGFEAARATLFRLPRHVGMIALEDALAHRQRRFKLGQRLRRLGPGTCRQKATLFRQIATPG